MQILNNNQNLNHLETINKIPSLMTKENTEQQPEILKDEGLLIFKPDDPVLCLLLNVANLLIGIFMFMLVFTHLNALVKFSPITLISDFLFTIFFLGSLIGLQKTVLNQLTGRVAQQSFLLIFIATTTMLVVLLTNAFMKNKLEPKIQV